MYTNLSKNQKTVQNSLADNLQLREPQPLCSENFRRTNGGARAGVLFIILQLKYPKNLWGNDRCADDSLALIVCVCVGTEQIFSVYVLFCFVLLYGYARHLHWNVKYLNYL